MTDKTMGDAAPAQGGIVREWIAPIALGLVIGAAIVGAWKYGPKLLENQVDRLVAQWDSEDWEKNDELAASLAKLGKEVRPDVLRKFRSLEVPPDPWDEDQKKVWVGMRLAAEPFFDSRSLLEVCRDASAPAWDRRCAAAALVHSLGKDADPTAVSGPLLEWLQDLKASNHQIAYTSLRVLVDEQTFPPDRRNDLRLALLALAARASRPVPADEEDGYRILSDRLGALNALARMVRDEGVLDAMWKIAEDESDSAHVRSTSIQALAANGQFDDVERWKRLSGSADHVIRQTVADNVSRSQKPEFDPILIALHSDPDPFVRKSSVEAQIDRRRPTMFPMIEVLAEDQEEGVREAVALSIGAFKDDTDRLGLREGIALRILEKSDSDAEVGAAVLSLHQITGQSFGFAPSNFDAANRMVDRNAVAAFRGDTEGRAKAVAMWREHLGGNAVYPDDVRKKALETLLQHADPKNRERAAAELAK